LPGSSAALASSLHLPAIRGCGSGADLNCLARVAFGPRQGPGRPIEPRVRQRSIPAIELNTICGGQERSASESGYSKESPLKTTIHPSPGGTPGNVSLPDETIPEGKPSGIGIVIDSGGGAGDAVHALSKGVRDEMNATSRHTRLCDVSPAFKRLRPNRRRFSFPFWPIAPGRRQLGASTTNLVTSRRLDPTSQAETFDHPPSRTNCGAGAFAESSLTPCCLGGFATKRPLRTAHIRRHGQAVRAGPALVPGSDDAIVGGSRIIAGDRAS